MTAEEIARLLNGRRVGKNKWMAKCVAHPDKHPSLSISVGRLVPVLLKCQSAGCSTESILAAMGLTWSALFDGKATPEVRRRVSLQEQREALDRQLGLVVVLGAIEKGKKRYWAGAEKRIRGEIEEIRCVLEPEKVIRECMARRFRWRLQRLGYEAIWEETHGVLGTNCGTEPYSGDAREGSIHDAPPQLQAGRLQGGSA